MKTSLQFWQFSWKFAVRRCVVKFAAGVIGAATDGLLCPLNPLLPTLLAQVQTLYLSKESKFLRKQICAFLYIVFFRTKPYLTRHIIAWYFIMWYFICDTGRLVCRILIGDSVCCNSRIFCMIWTFQLCTILTNIMCAQDGLFSSELFSWPLSFHPLQISSSSFFRKPVWSDHTILGPLCPLSLSLFLHHFFVVDHLL